jgi:WD40 repeat protein
MATQAPGEAQQAGRLDQHGDPLPDGAVARLGTVRWRARCAWCLTFSRDGKLLAAGNSDRTARFWDTATGREVLRVHGNGLGEVQHIALSPDGRTLATLDSERPVRFWDARTGKHLRDGESRVGSIVGAAFTFTFSPDGRTLYAGAPGSVQAITVAEGRTAVFPPGPVRDLSVDTISPDGATAVSAGDGRRLVVWDLRAGKVLAEVAAPPQRGLLALSPDGKRLAVATKGVEFAVVVYDLAARKELSRCTGHRAWVSSLAFSPDGKTLATGSGDLTARLWDTESGKQRWAYSAFRVNFYWVAVAFSPDGKAVGVAGWDGIVRLLDAVTGKERVWLPGHLGWVDRLAITPDSRTVFTSGEDGSLRLWEVSTGKPIRLIRGPGLDRYDPKQQKVISAEAQWIKSLNLTPDGKALVVGDYGSLRMWDLADRDRPRAGEEIDNGFQAALSPDGKVLATLRGGIRLRDLRTNKPLHERKVSDAWKLRFSPDGGTLAIGGSEGAVRLYDVRTLQRRVELRAGDVQIVKDMAFSPDGQLLATNGGGWRVHVWEVASGQLRRRVERKESMMDALAFSPDGRYLAMAGTDSNVSLHDLAAGQVVRTFRGHDGWIPCLAFTPDGRRLVSGSHDTTGLVWDVQAVPARKPRQVKRSAEELDLLWERLAGNAGQADAAMRQLAASPAQAVSLVRRSVKPVEKGTAERIARLVRALDSRSFAERERAGEDLEELGEEAAGALRAALEARPSAEMERRARTLLDRLKTGGPSPAHLRALRAVQLLAWIGTAEARRSLEAVAAGAPEARLTRAASAALACLKRR